MPSQNCLFPHVTCLSLVKTQEKLFKYVLTQRASTSVPGQQFFELLVNNWSTNGLKACWVHILVESGVVQRTCLTRQACTSSPGQQFVEPTWFRFVHQLFDPASLYKLGQAYEFPAFFPTLVALLPALAPSAVLVRTHWHVRVPVLCYCGANNVFEPLVSQPIC